ncbi:hypothetical protein D0T51_01830 [Parabacteroides sp. 52]|uniref:LolA family protein n=1 Tax=unclassified Parabacteroides TaxID=2649774 RepID=UPI0013D7E4AC|nr:MULTISPECIES: LolA-like putative outer membrane lipoprotein chaperone [unclassified Parabacteroides]MDH6533723.1 outer membrane lipoprotein-sorting protein [Parabacteroides sp. PM5-20]NDV54475.1 hypothetical protein [Parabacteroides sp. 52]
MKNRICFVVLYVCIVFSASAQKGADILDKAAGVWEKANGLSATFALHVRGEAQQINESFEGVIQIKGDKFTWQTPDMHVWYDGKTQWSYAERTGEVNVTEPSGEELQQSNPTLLLRMYKKGYKANYLGESTAANGKTAYDVELTPKKKEDIVKVVLQIEKISSLPARITIEAKNGTRTTIQIDKLTTGLDQADAFFVFDAKAYPDAEVIDLR